MSRQTHCWPRSNNINIFHKDTYKNKDGHSLHMFLIVLYIKSLSRWKIAPISWIYLWLAMETYSQMCATKTLGKSSSLFKSLNRIRECTEQEGAPFLKPLVLVSMHIWCCVHIVETCWHICKQASFKEITQWKKKIIALNGRGVHYLSWHSFSSPSGFSGLFEQTSAQLWGRIGPGFNCMNWPRATQLKCFKCLCLSLKHRDSCGWWHKHTPLTEECGDG